jgi:hypothetical protein
MEGKGMFGGWTARSPEVAATMERDGREGRKKGGGGMKLRLNRYALKGVSLSDTLL